MAEDLTSRYDFEPTDGAAAMRQRILNLMKDGVARSVVEIQDALGTRKEVSARIRELRLPKYGAWAFNDSRADGPESDGVFRYRLKLNANGGAERNVEVTA